jgi:hypothetical protein
MSSAIADEHQAPRRPIHPAHHPLSKETSRHLLRAMLERAMRGDLDAAERLVRLGREARRTAPDTE